MDSITPSDQLVEAGSASPIEAGAQGLMSALQGYLGTTLSNQQDVEHQKQLSAIQAQKEIDVYKGEHPDNSDPIYVDQESVGKLWDQVSPQMGQAVRGTIKAYNSDPRNKGNPLTWEQYKNSLSGQIDKVGDLLEKGSPSFSFIGNDANGLPILADKKGNMKMGDGTDKPYSGPVFPKSSNVPTASTRSSAEFAGSVRDHIKDMRELVNEADTKGYIGPVAGRVYQDFMAGKVGSTGNPDADSLLGQLRSTNDLIKTAAMRVHFGARGGQQMFDHFSNILNSGKQSKAMLNGELDTLDKFMAGYQKAGKLGGGSVESPADIEAKKASLRAKLGI